MIIKKIKPFITALLLVGIIGSTIYLYTLTHSIRWEDNLHYLMHVPWIRNIMGWIGLSEEEVLKGVKVYWCPMHPRVKRDKPGLCPICNMQLVEMEEDKNKRSDVLILTDRQMQQGGVRTARVNRLSLTHQIDTAGRVDVDERLFKTISNWVPGKNRIEVLHVNFTGEVVQKGDLLVSLYSPELITTQVEYLMLLKEDNPIHAPLLKAAELRLKRWGVSEKQIDEIQRKRRPLETIPIYSPMSGTVIERLASEGQYVTEGEIIYKLADLSKVWIYADIYEYELPFVSVGMSVDVSPEGIPGKTIKGRVDFIEPVLQTASRTVQVRIEAENQDDLLKPGMYASVRIHIPSKEMLVVPENAVLFSGRRAMVLLSEGNGLIRPVEVRIGKKWLYSNGVGKEKEFSFLEKEDRYHEVLSGLKDGQEVLIGGNFLVAAEAQFQGVLKKMLPQENKTSEKMW